MLRGSESPIGLRRCPSVDRASGAAALMMLVDHSSVGRVRSGLAKRKRADDGSLQGKWRKMQEKTLKDAITKAAEMKIAQQSEPVSGCDAGAKDSPTTPTTLSEQIRMAHAYVEHCLVRYLSRDEAIQKVEEFSHCRIRPELVESVWIALEEGNPAFFKRFNTTIMLKQQLESFNQLVSEQHTAMKYIGKSTQLKQVEVDITKPGH